MPYIPCTTDICLEVKYFSLIETCCVCVWFQVRYPADYFYPILLFFAQLLLLLLLLELFDLTDPLVV